MLSLYYIKALLKAIRNLSPSISHHVYLVYLHILSFLDALVKVIPTIASIWAEKGGWDLFLSPSLHQWPEELKITEFSAHGPDLPALHSYVNHTLERRQSSVDLCESNVLDNELSWSESQINIDDSKGFVPLDRSDRSPSIGPLTKARLTTLSSASSSSLSTSPTFLDSVDWPSHLSNLRWWPAFVQHAVIDAVHTSLSSIFSSSVSSPALVNAKRRASSVSVPQSRYTRASSQASFVEKSICRDSAKKMPYLNVQTFFQDEAVDANVESNVQHSRSTPIIVHESSLSSPTETKSLVAHMPISLSSINPNSSSFCLVAETKDPSMALAPVLTCAIFRLIESWVQPESPTVANTTLRRVVGSLLVVLEAGGAADIRVLRAAVYLYDLVALNQGLAVDCILGEDGLTTILLVASTQLQTLHVVRSIPEVNVGRSEKMQEQCQSERLKSPLSRQLSDTEQYQLESLQYLIPERKMLWPALLAVLNLLQRIMSTMTGSQAAAAKHETIEAIMKL